MIVEIATVIGASIAVLIVSSIIGNWLTQTIAMGGLAYYLLTIGMVSLPFAIIIALVPTILRVILWTYLLVMSWRALRGAMGEETKWAAELFEESDEEFMEATRALPQQELRENAIIAETKDGLRELTIERYKELKESE